MSDTDLKSNRVHSAILAALAAGPTVVERLLADLSLDGPWDFTLDPERFTLRAIVAHLADAEPITIERIIRMRDGDEPVFEAVDYGRLAIDNDYVGSDPHERLSVYRSYRATLIDILGRLNPEEWDRVGVRDFGRITIANQALMAASHDGYHAQQIVQWLAAANHKDK